MLTKGLLYQALAPAQERRLAQHHRNRQRGRIARRLIPECSRAPPQLAQPDFFISPAARTSRLVSASSTKACLASLAKMLAIAYGTSVVRRRRALHQAAILVFPARSRRIKSLNSLLPRLPMIRQPPRTNGNTNVNKNAAHSQTHVMGKRLHDMIAQKPYPSRRQIAGGELICQLASSSIHPSIHVRG